MAHYQIKLKERRISERKKLTGLMPGRFQIDGRDVSARPVDISEHGIGILVASEYKPGTLAVLVIKDVKVELEMKWGQPDFGKHDMWRYGLVCKDQNINLEQIFIEKGCLK
jgi:hypothetical protein